MSVVEKAKHPPGIPPCVAAAFACAAAPAWPFAAFFAPRALTDPEGWLCSPDGPACAPDVPFMAAVLPPCPDGPASPTGPGCPPWVATRLRYRRYFCKWLATFSRVSPSTCMISRIFLGTASARKEGSSGGNVGVRKGASHKLSHSQSNSHPHSNYYKLLQGPSE